MTLREYLWDLLVSERDIVEELLTLDNKVEYTNFLFYELVGMLDFAAYPSKIIDGKFDILTDGEPDTVYMALLGYATHIEKIHVNQSFLGINNWLVSRVKKYYADKGEPLSLEIDEKVSYDDYQNSKKVVAYGFPEL